MKDLSVALLITMNCFAYSQNLDAGLIYSDSTNQFKGCCVYVPSNGFRLYDKPSGEITAYIERGEADQNDEVYKIYLIEPQGDRKMISHTDLEVVGYEVFSLPYSDRKSGFVKVLDRYWINEQEIESSFLKAIDYRKFLILQANLVLGYYAKPPGLNLREGPSTEYKVIKTLKGDTLQISLTNDCEGLWCKVKVVEYKEHPCVSEATGKQNVKDQYEGWVKLLDDGGTPNVWYYAKGC